MKTVLTWIMIGLSYLVLLVACVSSINKKIEKTETFVYDKKIITDILTVYHRIEITLNTDKTFLYKETAPISLSEFSGIWNYLSDNKIELIFDDLYSKELEVDLKPKGEYVITILNDKKICLSCSEWKKTIILNRKTKYVLD